jgi:hypothetical protein
MTNFPCEFFQTTRGRFSKVMETMGCFLFSKLFRLVSGSTGYHCLFQSNDCSSSSSLANDDDENDVAFNLNKGGGSTAMSCLWSSFVSDAVSVEDDRGTSDDDDDDGDDGIDRRQRQSVGGR